MVKCWLCCTSQPNVSNPSQKEPTQPFTSQPKASSPSNEEPTQPFTSQPRVSTPPHEESTQLFTSQPKISSPTPSPIPTASSPPPFMESMKLIKQQLERDHPTDQIDPLITFIDNLLQKIKASPEEASTSSFPLDSVASNTRLAANMIDKISTEADNFKDLAKEMGNLALNGLKMVGEAHWLFLGLSVAACALERCVTVRSNDSDCIELLQKIGSLAKYLKEFRKVVPGENDELREAVKVIVEGAVMCCGYMSKGKISKLVTLNPFTSVQ